MFENISGDTFEVTAIKLSGTKYDIHTSYHVDFEANVSTLDADITSGRYKLVRASRSTPPQQSMLAIMHVGEVWRLNCSPNPPEEFYIDAVDLTNRCIKVRDKTIPNRYSVWTEAACNYWASKGYLSCSQCLATSPLAQSRTIESSVNIVKKLSGTECECGKDKHGFASHCTWCPKYEDRK
jgi:hypothetical protein